MEDPVIVALRQERDALREEVAILKFNLKVAIGKLPQDLKPPIPIDRFEMRREISRTHQPGFMWDAAQGVYVEADARFRERIKIDYEFRERMLNIRNSAGSTMQKLYIDDACLRIEHMTQRHEIAQVAVVTQGPARVVKHNIYDGRLEEPDDSYKQRLQQYLRSMAA